MISLLFTFILLLGALATPVLPQNLQAHKTVTRLMGSRFEITAVAADSALAQTGIAAAITEIARIERLISSWNPNSQTSEINRNAGKKAVTVDRELFELIRRSQKVSALTGGAFDISFASVDKIYTFDGGDHALPSPDSVAVSVAKIGYQNIVLDEKNSTVFLKEPGMKIGFGGIGKGYAANRAQAVMLEAGILSGLVNAGGDLIAWGKQPDGSDWQIAIADPNDEDKILGWLTLGNLAIVTSGDYARYFTSDGKRYAHIIDPETGYPVTGMKSVSVVCADAELADALATAVFVLGENKGMKLIEQLRGIECLIVNSKNEIKTSRNLQLSYRRRQGLK